LAHVPVVLIHGFPFDHLLWRHQVAALSGWRCMAPDLRGAGSSSGPRAVDEFSMASYADDLIGLLDYSEVSQAVVCGLSMGGYIAFELLRRFPERVSAAILCNTKAAADSPEAKLGRDALAARAEQSGAGAVADALLPKLLARTTQQRQPGVASEVREMILRQPVWGIVGALRALRDRPDSTPLLGRIGVPVLVVAGDDDQITPAAEMEAMQRAIPGAQYTLVPDAGHMTPLEQPRALTKAIRGFLSTLG
jgi:pimeloyl-ACP methyl ester carboxylesterase